MANRNAANVFTSFGTLAAIYPANSQRTNETLPFVTLDGFDTIVSNSRNASKASLIHFAPLLRTQQEVEQWNAYSSRQTAWVAQGRRHQSFDDNVNTSDALMPYAFDEASDWTITPSSVPNGNGYVCPVWQMSPLPPRLDIINYNTYMLDASRVSMEHAAATGEPSLTEPVPEALRDLFSIDVQGPVSLLHYPVYKDVDSSSDEDNVVAFVSGILAWKTFFDNALPDGPEEVLVVVESCSVQSTFLIQGPTATFIGDGSLHNPKYSNMQRSEIFVGSATPDVATEQKGQCQHRVNVFPTERMQSSHVTNKPTCYAVVVIAIFALAALVFHLFAVYVARRQDRTKRQANQSNSIVQELFPGDVATKLFETDVEMPRSPSRRISNTMKVERTNTIAELHPDATVLCK
jgi:CHASE domain